MPDHQSGTMSPPTRYNRSELIQLANSCTTLPIIACVTWDTLHRLGLCARDPTPRGSRGGSRKSRPIHVVSGHRPDAPRHDRLDRQCAVTQITGTVKDKPLSRKQVVVGHINARSLVPSGNNSTMDEIRDLVRTEHIT